MKKRNYGIDLLRIISMMQILMLHTLGHGGILSSLTPSSPLYKYAWFFEISCYGAVNCFALISGFVGVNSNFTYKKIIPLWLQASIYSGIISTLFYIYKPDTITLKETILSYMPVLNNTYWFFTMYFVLALFIPVLNPGINSLTKKQAIKTSLFLSITLTLTYLIFQFNCFDFILTKDIFILKGGYSALWLISLYVIGGCIKKHNLLSKIPSLILIFLNIISIFLTIILKIKLSFEPSIIPANALINYCSPTILLASITALELFSRFRFPKSIEKIISFFAPISFGAYLLQDHPLVRKNIIKGRFAQIIEYDTAQFVMRLIIIVLVTYIILALIDYIRLLIFKLLFHKKTPSK